MKTPKIEEVREYFKDAKVVECLIGDDMIKLEDSGNISYKNNGQFWYQTENGKRKLLIYDDSRGYAKIISYKDKSYQITEKQIKEVEKGELNMIELFPEVFKPVLEVGKWYKMPESKALICITANAVGIVSYYGFNYNGNWIDEANISSNALKHWVEATEEEVKTALINEAERRGYKEGVKVKCLFDNEIVEISDVIFDFIVNIGTASDGLWISSNSKIFNNGKWAKIVKEEPVELSLQEIADKFEIDVELLKIKK